MSEHNGVRMACPDCTWACTMHSEGELPDGVNHVEHGVPFCPNCRVPMKPVGSVPPVNGREHGSGPSPGLGEGLPLAERLAKIREAEREVATAKSEWEDAKSEASDAKKVYDGKVVTLCTLIERLTSVSSPKPLPLFDGTAERVADGTAEPMTETPGVVSCGAVGPVDALPCTLATGHEGPHVNEPTGDGVRDAVTGELIEELSRSTVSWPNEAEAMATELDEAHACLHTGPDNVSVCTRPKGHAGAHIHHVALGENAGQEFARWPQDAPQEAIEAPADDEPAAATESLESREDEALPLPKRRGRKKSQTEAHA